MTPNNPRVLLVNDDGPPAPNSPHVLGLFLALRSIGWDVTVVLPSSQKSWGSMQFSLAGPVSFWYYYPLSLHPSISLPSSWSATRRPLNTTAGEVGEWILVDGSPTTAANAGLFNQPSFFGDGGIDTVTPFDLVISGPNFGRNTGTAFAMSSGTLGAALVASLSGVKSIAVSYGHFMSDPPTLSDRGFAKGPALSPSRLSEIGQLAHKLTVSLIQRLWTNWGAEEQVGCYSINLPLSETLTSPEFVWTRIWENRYGPLFAPSPSPPTHDALPPTAPKAEKAIHFAPQMASLLRPKTLKEGTDVWAVQNGYVSITRLRPNFMEIDAKGDALPNIGTRWRL